MASEKWTKLMFTSLKYRMLLMCAWIFCILGLVFASFPFFLGKLILKGDAPFAMFQYNTTNATIPNSNVVQPHSHDAGTVETVTGMMKSTNFTQLGLSEWYTISFCWTCRGVFQTVDGEEPKYKYMTKPDCQSTMFNKRSFTMHEEIKDLSVIQPQHKKDAIEQAERAGIYFWLWFTAGCLMLLNFITYPWMFRRGKLLGTKNWCIIPCCLALTIFCLLLVTLTQMEWQSRQTEVLGIKPRIPGPFRAFAILSMFCMLLSFIVGLIGYGVGALIETALPNVKFDAEYGHPTMQKSGPTDWTLRNGDPEKLKFRPNTVLVSSTGKLYDLNPATIDENQFPELVAKKRRENNNREVRRQVKHISEHVAEHVAKMEAIMEHGHDAVKCPVCDLDRIQKLVEERIVSNPELIDQAPEVVVPEMQGAL